MIPNITLYSGERVAKNISSHIGQVWTMTCKKVDLFERSEFKILRMHLWQKIDKICGKKITFEKVFKKVLKSFEKNEKRKKVSLAKIGCSTFDFFWCFRIFWLYAFALFSSICAICASFAHFSMTPNFVHVVYQNCSNYKRRLSLSLSCHCLILCNVTFQPLLVEK
jgi:hypothetical protein